jgi:Hemerythrin HHE cation binding domain
MAEDPRQRSHVFRVQHRELLEVVRELDAQLDVATLAADATRARTLLSMLAGKLAVHLAMEDKALYPRLLQHQNTEIRDLASEFMKDMGGIHAVFTEYVARWPTPQAIQADGARFALETKQIFDALGKRIKAEHSRLFPELDNT